MVPNGNSSTAQLHLGSASLGDAGRFHLGPHPAVHHRRERCEATGDIEAVSEAEQRGLTGHFLHIFLNFFAMAMVIHALDIPG